jgi:hypothetical protein
MKRVIHMPYTRGGTEGSDEGSSKVNIHGTHRVGVIWYLLGRRRGIYLNGSGFRGERSLHAITLVTEAGGVSGVELGNGIAAEAGRGTFVLCSLKTHFGTGIRSCKGGTEDL